MSVLEEADRKRNIGGDPLGAVRILEEALPKVPDKEEPQILLRLANYYIDIGEVEKAKRSFEGAIKISRKHKDFLTEADAKRKFAYLLWHQDADKKKALTLTRSALSTLKKVSDKSKEKPKVAANIYATFGNVYGDSRDLRKASLWYHKALKTAQKAGFKERVVTVLGDLGNLSMWRKDFRKAEGYFQKAAQGAKRYYRHAYPSSVLRLGRLYLLKGNLKKAKKFAERSLQVAEKENWEREKADALEVLGDVYLSFGEKVGAKERYTRALKIYRKLKHSWNISSVRGKLKELESKSR